MSKLPNVPNVSNVSNVPNVPNVSNVSNVPNVPNVSKVDELYQVYQVGGKEALAQAWTARTTCMGQWLWGQCRCHDFWGALVAFLQEMLL